MFISLMLAMSALCSEMGCLQDLDRLRFVESEDNSEQWPLQTREKKQEAPCLPSNIRAMNKQYVKAKKSAARMRWLPQVDITVSNGEVFVQQIDPLIQVLSEGNLRGESRFRINLRWKLDSDFELKWHRLSLQQASYIDDLRASALINCEVMR